MSCASLCLAQESSLLSDSSHGLCLLAPAQHTAGPSLTAPSPLPRVCQTKDAHGICNSHHTGRGVESQSRKVIELRSLGKAEGGWGHGLGLLSLGQVLFPGLHTACWLDLHVSSAQHL